MIYACILAGGSGTRLWPLSRKGSPKQFVKIGDQDSLFANTVKRAKDIAEDLFVVASEKHQFMVKDELNGESATVLLEPEGKNSAPAIALAALESSVDGDDPILLVMPSDHIITEEQVFVEAIQSSLPQAEVGKLITFGAKPLYPETGYGYIKLEKINSSASVHAVDAFVEKPDESLAKSYVQSGEYFWNTGIFMFKASSYLSELKSHAPDIYESCVNAFQAQYIDLGDIKFDASIFSKIPDDSIDYAVLEKSSNVMCTPVDMGWSDLGAWNCVADSLVSSHHQNTIVKDATNNHVVSTNKEKIVSLVGVDNIVVVDTEDALLVVEKSQAQKVKSVVEDLKQAGSTVVDLPHCVHRPWGTYESIAYGRRYKVKRIVVKPGASLSLQLHHHRAEHWIVVSGTARVTNGEKSFLLSENESTYIPIGVTHRLENPGKFELELIEVQSGSYLEEDDIVRIEDTYGRVKAKA